MSIRAIELFYLEIKKNSKLRSEVENAKARYANKKLSPLNAEQFIENGLIPLARKHGMNFSLDDLIDFASKEHAELLEKQRELMSDDELVAVSGGKNVDALVSLQTFLTLVES